MVIALIAMAFAIGVLWQKVQNLQGPSVNANAGTPAPAAAAQPTIKVTRDQIKDLWSKDLVKFGDANSKVLFVEVADPSCPYCHAAAGTNGTINKQVGLTLVSDGGTYIAPVTEMEKLIKDNQASFAYIYFPGHGNGEMAMKALYCANEKGKFWEAHNLLMTNPGYELINTTVKNDKAQSQTVANFLKQAVDPSFLKTCLDSGKYDSHLTADSSIAQSLGVSGTPGFFVNDTAFPGAYSYSDMKSIVDAALK